MVAAIARRGVRGIHERRCELTHSLSRKGYGDLEANSKRFRYPWIPDPSGFFVCSVANKSYNPVIALTPGEPAGVGPELCLQLAQRPMDCTLVLIADPALLEQQLAPAAASPEAVLTMLEEPAPPADKAMLTDPAFRAVYLTNLTESLRQGAKATAWDLHLVDRPWGIDLARIQQPVKLWHGTDDINAPIAMGHYLAQTLPQCTARFMKDEGHVSILNHMEVILRELMI